MVAWEPPAAMSKEKRLFWQAKRVEAGEIHFENLEKENLNKPQIVEKINSKRQIKKWKAKSIKRKPQVKSKKEKKIGHWPS